MNRLGLALVAIALCACGDEAPLVTVLELELDGCGRELPSATQLQLNLSTSDGRTERRDYPGSNRKLGGTLTAGLPPDLDDTLCVAVKALDGETERAAGSLQVRIRPRLATDTTVGPYVIKEKICLEPIALEPEVLASGQDRPSTLLVDEQNVYWLNFGGEPDALGEHRGAVMRLPKAGGAPEVLTETQTFAWALALDGPGGNQLVFADAARLPPPDFAPDPSARVGAVGRDGADPRTLVDGIDTVLGLVADESAAYFGTYITGRLLSVPLLGSSRVDELHRDMAGIDGVTLDDGSLYWLNQFTAQVQRFDRESGQVALVAQDDAAGLSNLLLIGTFLLWTNAQQGYIKGVPAMGGAVVPAALNEAQPIALAVDPTAQALYWVNADGTVRKSSFAGCAPFTIARVAESIGIPAGLAVDADHVYLSNAGDSGPISGTVVRLPR